MKTCANCGCANDDQAVFCSGCGADLSSAEPIAAAPAAKKAASPMAIVMLIVNIILAPSCCCSNGLIGIVSTILFIVGAVLAGISMSKGEEGKKMANTALILTIVGLVLGIITLIVSLVIGMGAGMLPMIMEEFY